MTGYLKYTITTLNANSQITSLSTKNETDLYIQSWIIEEPLLFSNISFKFAAQQNAQHVRHLLFL